MIEVLLLFVVFLKPIGIGGKDIITPNLPSLAHATVCNIHSVMFIYTIQKVKIKINKYMYTRWFLQFSTHFLVELNLQTEKKNYCVSFVHVFINQRVYRLSKRNSLHLINHPNDTIHIFLYLIVIASFFFFL